MPAAIEGEGTLPSFALDATTWNIDTNEFAKAWAQAQSQLGLAIDATDSKRFDLLKHWNLNSQAKGDSKFGAITFIGMAKVNSEQISTTLDEWKKKETSGSKTCTVAFV
jgi:hypothetical protein